MAPSLGVSRIIAGTRRGHRLTMPATSRTRPTADRVREAVFSAIVSWAGVAAVSSDESMAGLGFADLYAGSGAIGLEAASRGAAPVLLVESDRRTADVARANADSLRLAVEIHTATVQQLVAGPRREPFDVVWLDPPYEVRTEVIDGLLDELVANQWVAVDGLIVVERGRRSDPVSWPAGFSGGWTRRYGETMVSYGKP